MSLNVWACFQRGMSLNGSRWVDHGSHGDRHERDASVRAGAAQGLGTGEIRFKSVGDDEGRYSHIQAVLKRFAYPRLKRADKGLVLRYLGRTTRAIHGNS